MARLAGVPVHVREIESPDGAQYAPNDKDLRIEAEPLHLDAENILAIRAEIADVFRRRRPHGTPEGGLTARGENSGVISVGVFLYDCKTNEVVFDTNFWHYRAIVEAIRRLGVLPDAKVDALHDLWCGNGLSTEEARAVASMMRSALLPTLASGQRLLLDGTRTTDPDDGTLYRDEESHRNYSTDADVLELFVKCCETCNGFRVG